MIIVRFKQKEDNLLSFSVVGHAEYEEGNEIIYDDVVCGVVSNLAQVTILGVIEVLKHDAPYVAEDGDIQFDISGLDAAALSECQVLFRTMLLGLRNLEISYGEYIKVSVEEVQ
jgi:Predicted ribosomal protein